MRSRERLYAQQLGQGLPQMAQALRAGLGLSPALAAAAEDGDAPLSDEWRRVLAKVRLGSSWPDALADLPERVPVPEMRWFVAAVELSRTTGASLAEMLDTLAETLQARLALQQKVRAVSAPGQATGLVLSVLPAVILAALQILVPDLVKPLWSTPPGQRILCLMVILISIGGSIIWKMVHPALPGASLPEALDLLALLLQAGLDVQVALDRYLALAPPGPLKVELERLRAYFRSGLSREEALRRLRTSTPDGDLGRAAGSILQALRQGSSLAPMLRLQARGLRQSRTLEAERRAALIPIQLMLPLFVFIFPTVFLALFGPVMLALPQGGL